MQWLVASESRRDTVLSQATNQSPLVLDGALGSNGVIANSERLIVAPDQSCCASFTGPHPDHESQRLRTASHEVVRRPSHDFNVVFEGGWNFVPRVRAVSSDEWLVARAWLERIRATRGDSEPHTYNRGD